MENESAPATTTAPKRVLITGAAGYIGRLVTRALADDPRTVERIVAADVRVLAPRERISGVEHIVLDVRDPDLAAVVKTEQIDTVIHLAAIVSPTPGMPADLEYSVDVQGTRNVLEACVAGGVAQIIVTSSGAAYGYHPDNRALLTEDCPLRGNDEFPYSRNKRLVEEMLARYRSDHPSLSQLVFRPGTILGASVSNQITALFEKPIVMGLRGSATPFVFIWDRDVVTCIVEGAHARHAGIFNLAGDGVMTLREIAARLGKPYVSLPPAVVRGALTVLARFGLTRYGPEQTRFLQFRPVLSNARLKDELGYRPARTTRDVFELYCENRTA